MDLIKNIRTLYTPIQPTIKRSNKDVLYKEMIPHIGLQDFIYCYWELKTTAVLKEAFNYRVLL